MRSRDLKHLRDLLEAKLQELHDAAHHDVRDRVSQPYFGADDGGRDEADEAQRMIDEDNRMLHADRGSVLRRQVAAALQRMSSGEYGACIDCGGDIEVERLRAVPWALRCTADQEAHEFDGRDRSPTL